MPARLYLAVGAGSAFGALARYLLSLGMLSLLGPAFPWGTLAANTAGSFVMGLYVAVSEPGCRFAAAQATRVFVVAGFCGGFTTFSIFSLETLALARAGTPGLAGLYVGVSLGLWMLAVWLGHCLGARIDASARRHSAAPD